MPAELEPIKPVKCTYAHCKASFLTEKEMKKHKRNTEIHDYCHKCDQDFEDVDTFNEHKAFRPDKHDKACRLCVQEFKSRDGLRLHIELTHHVDQKIACIGCDQEFNRPWLYIEHLERNYCKGISPGEFQGYVAHKHLIDKILQGGEAQRRFLQKTSQYEAAMDNEEEGGVNLLDEDNDQAHEVDYPTLKPEIDDSVEAPHDFPPLRSKPKMSNYANTYLSTTLQGMSLTSETASNTGSSTSLGSPKPQEKKAWTSGSTTEKLFPNARATPTPSNWSVQEHDRSVEEQGGINILTTHFWDPLNKKDWNPERFYNSIINKYSCPFPCEQSFGISADLERHIKDDHRIRRMSCPTCLKYFDSIYRWVAHCESRGSKCPINKSDDFGTFLNKATGGFLSVEERIRPDHLNNPTVLVTNTETNRIETYKAPQMKYLQYIATKPPGFEKTAESERIGGSSQRKLIYYH